MNLACIMNNQYDQKEKKNNRSMTFCSLELGHTHYILLKTQMCPLYMHYETYT